MSILRDLFPAKPAADIEVGGSVIACRALTMGEVIHLIARFGDRLRVLTANPAEAFAAAPDICAAIIAAGVGAPDDAEEESAAMEMPAYHGARLLTAVIRLTAPEGIVPFINMVTELMGAATSSEQAPLPIPGAGEAVSLADMAQRALKRRSQSQSLH